jgi:GntR family transcriptional regulator
MTHGEEQVMFKIDLKNRTPIYEQVVAGFKRAIVTGEMTADQRVPSVRDMARELAVNPNTVQKAYREMETRGLIYTVAGQGSFVTAGDEMVKQHEIDALYTQLDGVVQELRFRGQTPQDVIAHIQGGDLQ